MASDADDDALSWGNATDPTHLESPVVVSSGEESDAGEPGMSSGMLVTLGVFGGVFLLFVVGWIIAVQRNTVPSAPLFNTVMYQLGEVLAIASPAAWFVGVMVLTRERKPGVRILWLLLGVLLLAPWSFILGGGAK
jgi:hypothetical protein